MAFLRRASDLLFSEPGPAGIVVTPAGSGVIIRLPNQRYSRDRTVPWLLVALIVGPIILFAAIRSTLNTPEDERNLTGTCVLIGATLTAMAAIVCAWRIVWHYEVLLRADSLHVDCISTFRRTSTAVVDLESVRQLTLVGTGKYCVLQAESATHRPMKFLSDQGLERTREVALILVQQHAILAPQHGGLRVTEEAETHVAASGDRAEPPLNSQVGLATTDAGLTLDFPLPTDRRPLARKSAWRLFEIAILILMAAVIWYAVCVIMEWGPERGPAGMAFLGGIIMLVIAAGKSMSSYVDNHQDEDLRQLSVVGNMLIRTSRDFRKKVWYGSEIRSVYAVVIESTSTGEGGQTSTTYALSLVLELHNAEKIGLLGSAYSPEDYRPKAEFEWIATKLRQALLGEPIDTKPAAALHVPSTGIQRLGNDSHIMA